MEKQKAGIVVSEAPTLEMGWRFNGRCREISGAVDNVYSDGLIRAIGGSLDASELQPLGINRLLVPTGKGTYDIYVPVK